MQLFVFTGKSKDSQESLFLWHFIRLHSISCDPLMTTAHVPHTGTGRYDRSASPVFSLRKKYEIEHSDSRTIPEQIVPKRSFFCHFVLRLKLDEWLTKKQKPSVHLILSVVQSGSAPVSGARGQVA